MMFGRPAGTALSGVGGKRKGAAVMGADDGKFVRPGSGGGLDSQQASHQDLNDDRENAEAGAADAPQRQPGALEKHEVAFRPVAS